jgi:uncharacterized protein YidB (DUF937 family)
MGLFDGILGGGMRRGGGMSPLTMALLGLLAYKTLKGKNLSDILGTPGAPAGTNPTGASTGAGWGGGLGGILGGLLGSGAAGSVLTGGLGDLLKQFQQSGQGDKAASWVSPGRNEPVSPSELEQALGDERMQWLMDQTGMSKQELLVGLSRELPQVVDKLTPEGRVPIALRGAVWCG